jgi:hypothetical protein
MRAAERQRHASNPAYDLADHVFGAVKGGGGFRCRPLRVAEPSRVVGDQPRRLEIGAHLGDMPTHVGVIGERLGITLRLAAVNDSAWFVKRRLRNAKGTSRNKRVIWRMSVW